jgi:2-keto-3-deoxy-L-rhamnonate aldolase RhmA
MIKYMLITNDATLAGYAEAAGVGRIFVDLEQLGKQERQGHLDTLKSKHDITDVAKVRKQVKQAQLLVRLNPIYRGSEQEIEQAIAGGADLLMLPMFRTAEELKSFTEMVDRRVGVIPLVETIKAAEELEKIVILPGVTEVYIGLNDLHLEMKLQFMFEPLANGLVDKMAAIIKKAGLPFGFGGIARVEEGIVPGELVLAEHLRLGSSSVILSRTFHRKSDDISTFKANLDLKHEMDRLFEKEQQLYNRSQAEILADRERLINAVNQFISDKQG